LKPVDVLIVGGGPAGLAAAIAASRKGLRAAVIDCRKPPIDKTCGEGLLPSAIAGLGALGIPLELLLGFPFSSFRFADEKSSVSAPIARGGGMGVRRRDLHQLLIERAEAEGVSLHWDARISTIENSGIWVQGAFRRCRWLVGADGQHSAVRKFPGLDSAGPVQKRFGFRRHFAVARWGEAVEVHWRDGVQLIVTPTGTEEVCVVLLSRDPHTRIARAIQQFPEIAQRLGGAQPISRETGTTTCLRRARAAMSGNVALVGDASCTMDGISGHGLSLAFKEALALADALAHENLFEYQAAHKRITRMPVRMTKLLLMLDASPFLRRAVLRVLARNPKLFSKLIALHVGGETTPHRTEGEPAGRRRAATLGCRLWEAN
jgi:menaquinone-9 beta-reductase